MGATGAQGVKGDTGATGAPGSAAFSCGAGADPGPDPLNAQYVGIVPYGIAFVERQWALPVDDSGEHWYLVGYEGADLAHDGSLYFSPGVLMLKGALDYVFDLYSDPINGTPLLRCEADPSSPFNGEPAIGRNFWWGQSAPIPAGNFQGKCNLSVDQKLYVRVRRIGTRHDCTPYTIRFFNF
jgi:hypothetical protein